LNGAVRWFDDLVFGDKSIVAQPSASD